MIIDDAGVPHHHHAENAMYTCRVVADVVEGAAIAPATDAAPHH